MRGYHQVPTHGVTIAEIVNDPDFQSGLSDFFSDRPLPPFNGHWEYERGRLFAACFLRDHPYASPFDLDRSEIVRLAVGYFAKREIL